MRKIAIGFGAILLAWGFTAWAYPSLPERVATHWGISGKVDGWSSKWFLLVVLPAISVGLGLLLTVLPKIDPRKKEVAAHSRTYWLLVNVVLVFIASLQVLLVGVNLGWPLEVPRLVPIGVGLLFMVIGNLMPRMRPNWFMGIRTPWTLSSERVWRKTHRLGGFCFMGAGLMIAALGAFPSRFQLPYVLPGAIVLALLPVPYSYLAWRREQEAAPSVSREPQE